MEHENEIQDPQQLQDQPAAGAVAGAEQPAKKTGYHRKPGVDPKLSEIRSAAGKKGREVQARNEIEKPKLKAAERRSETEKLHEQLQELRQHAAQECPGLDDDFFRWGERILKAGIWGKEPVDHIDPLNLDLFLWDDQQLPFEQQEFVDGWYVAEAASMVAALGRQVHLTEPLVRFLIKVLNTAKKEFFLKYPEGKFTREEVQDVLTELDLRRQGVDSFDPWPPLPERKPVGREINISKFPDGLKQKVINGVRLDVLELRQFMILALEQPNLSEDLRKEYEEALRLPPEQPKEHQPTPDPTTASLSPFYQPPPTFLDQAALDYLRNGRKF
jgi:hypothetical protein